MYGSVLESGTLDLLRGVFVPGKLSIHIGLVQFILILTAYFELSWNQLKSQKHRVEHNFADSGTIWFDGVFWGFPSAFAEAERKVEKRQLTKVSHLGTLRQLKSDSISCFVLSMYFQSYPMFYRYDMFAFRCTASQIIKRIRSSFPFFARQEQEFVFIQKVCWMKNPWNGSDRKPNSTRSVDQV